MNLIINAYVITGQGLKVARHTYAATLSRSADSNVSLKKVTREVNQESLNLHANKYKCRISWSFTSLISYLYAN